MKKILQIKNLQTNFYTTKGVSKIINGLNLDLKEGRMLGLVGESGSGKSVLASSIMGWVKHPGKFDAGQVIFDENIDLLQLGEKELTKYRGTELGLIAANARGHLNPVMRVGDQIATAYFEHHKGTKYKDALQLAQKMLDAVGINDSGDRMKAYPHELSGGMAQRVMIALALINSPRVLIADDATNGLDVTVQAQIMDLIQDMIQKNNMSCIFITHDLGVVAQCCSEIAIMYCGQIVEMATIGEFYSRPVHPYSKNLLYSVPEYRHLKEKDNLWQQKVDPYKLPSGCLFNPKCRHATEKCRANEPEVFNLGGEHLVKCHYAREFYSGEGIANV